MVLLPLIKLLLEEKSQRLLNLNKGEKASSLGDLFTIVKKIGEKVLYTFHHPLASPRETVILISIVVVLILILIVLFLIILLVRKKIEETPEKEEVKEVKKKLSKKKIFECYLIFSGMALFLFLVSLTITSHPKFCASCHLIKEEYESWKKSTHSKVTCLSCHNEPGALSYLIGKVKGAGNFLAYIVRNFKKPVAYVSNSSCLSCHKKILSKMTVSKVRISHQEIIKAGASCVDCHKCLVHKRAKGEKVFVMDKCLTCHNDQKASSSCPTCHHIDIAYNPSLNLDDFPKVHLESPTNCQGCHSKALERKCFNCHRIEMPHTSEFINGGHARAAFINKAICYRCHAGCQKCHIKLGAFWPHPSNWIITHRKYKASDCSNCHVANICGLCHPEMK